LNNIIDWLQYDISLLKSVGTARHGQSEESAFIFHEELVAE
jgi:hypothetical protein